MRKTLLSIDVVSGAISRPETGGIVGKMDDGMFTSLDREQLEVVATSGNYQGGISGSSHVRCT